MTKPHTRRFGAIGSIVGFTARGPIDPFLAAAAEMGMSRIGIANAMAYRAVPFRAPIPLPDRSRV